MKKHQKLYDRIHAYQHLVVTEVFCIPEHQVDAAVKRATNSSYANCCKLIREGRATEEELIDQYPL